MKTNFTKDHEIRLKELYTQLSFSGKKLPGNLGANYMSPYDLLHTTSPTSLQELYIRLGKEVESKEGADRWKTDGTQSSTVYNTKRWQEFVDLLIGYKLHKEEMAQAKEELSKLIAEAKRLEEDSKTPKQKLADIKKQIAELEAYGE